MDFCPARSPSRTRGWSKLYFLNPQERLLNSQLDTKPLKEGDKAPRSGFMASKTQTPPLQKHSPDKYSFPSYPSAHFQTKAAAVRGDLATRLASYPHLAALPGEDLQGNQMEVSICFPLPTTKSSQLLGRWQDTTMTGEISLSLLGAGGERTSISKVSQLSRLV